MARKERFCPTESGCDYALETLCRHGRASIGLTIRPLKLKSPSAARRTRAGTTSSRRCTPQTVTDLRELTRSGQGIDPLKGFSEAARRELNAFAMV